DGSIEGVSNDGLRPFLERGAAGEIIVDQAAAVTGPLPAAYRLDIHADDLQVQPDETLILPLHADVAGFELGFDALDVLVMGKYSAAIGSYSDLALLLEKGAPKSAAASLLNCPDVRIEDWG